VCEEGAVIKNSFQSVLLEITFQSDHREDSSTFPFCKAYDMPIIKQKWLLSRSVQSDVQPCNNCVTHRTIKKPRKK